MSDSNLKVGIVGLPNVGKSTLFQALTKKRVDIANYPFATIDPNVGVVAVPDERLEALAKLVPQAEVSPAVIEIVDVAGLIKGAHKGEGLGNQFLSCLFSMNALLILVRNFHDEKVVSLAASPEEEFEIIRSELALKDSELKERATKSKTAASFNELSRKPYLTVCNINQEVLASAQNGKSRLCDIQLDAKLELELSELSPEEIKELGYSPKLSELIRAAYQKLDLVTFYTLKGGKELRAWPIKRGATAPEAGEIVHTDFKEKFIRAEVINWEMLLKAGSWQAAREKGMLKTEGKEYIVQDGDVVEFKI